MSAVIALGLVIVAALVLLFLFIRIIRLPLKWLFKLALHVALGFVALFILNFFGDYVGISLEMNLLNALVSGVLGVPGVILMLLFKYIL